MHKLYFIIGISLSLMSCQDSKKEVVTPRFQDVSIDSGLRHRHNMYPLEKIIQENSGVVGAGANVAMMLSGGVASGDIDNDGLVDLYFIGGHENKNYLYRNLGGGRFEDISKSSGLGFDSGSSNGPVFVDINADGFLDLFVGGVDLQEPEDFSIRRKKEYRHDGPPRIFLNQQDLRFQEYTHISGIYANTNTFSSTFGDIDLDGDLDAFTTHWSQIESYRPAQHIWKNNGKGFFYASDFEAGVADSFNTVDRTLTPNFSDINGDGYLDILLASDFETSQVFMNDQSGGYINKTNPFEINDENGMGSAVADYDNDGDMDWFVSSVRDFNPIQQSTYKWGTSGNRLYQNQGDGSFKNVTAFAGVRDGYWGWGSCFADFNQDGFADLFHVNGYGNETEKMWTYHKANKFFDDPSRLFLNKQDGTFKEASFESGINDTESGRGVVCTDLDNDGDVDIVVSNYGGAPKIYLNNMCNKEECFFAKIKLVGVEENRFAVGARITLLSNGLTQTQEITAGNNYLSNNPALAHFFSPVSLKGATLRIVWPDKKRTTSEMVLNVDKGALSFSHPDLKQQLTTKHQGFQKQLELAFTKGLNKLLDHPCKEDVVWALGKINSIYPVARIEAYIEKMKKHHAGSELEHLISKSSKPPRLNEDETGAYKFQNYMNAPFLKSKKQSDTLLRAFFSREESGYILTHQLFALVWAIEQRGAKSLPSDVVSKKIYFLNKILKEQHADNRFHDLYAERVAILLYYMGNEIAKSDRQEWLNTLLHTQLENGQWEGADYPIYTDFYGVEHLTPQSKGESSEGRDHTTVLSLMALSYYMSEYASSPAKY